MVPTTLAAEERRSKAPQHTTQRALSRRIVMKRVMTPLVGCCANLRRSPGTMLFGSRAAAGCYCYPLYDYDCYYIRTIGVVITTTNELLTTVNIDS